MRIKINRRSKAYRRVTAAGFKLININLIKKDDLYYPTIRFKCICGTVERITKIAYLKEGIPKTLDVAKMIEDAGAVSENHLISDGYSQEEIKYIRRAYK